MALMVWKHEWLNINKRHKYCNWNFENMIYPIIFGHDNIFVRYGNTVFHQIVVIPMGINCAPFIEDLLLYRFESYG